MLNCDIVINKFEYQLCYYIYFQTNTLGKSINLFIPLTMGYLTHS